MKKETALMYIHMPIGMLGLLSIAWGLLTFSRNPDPDAGATALVGRWFCDADSLPVLLRRKSRTE
ncbi:hypothetical protein ALCH109712_05790 [Alkalicoccus chagannorensis]